MFIITLNSKANKLEENLFSPRISLSVTEISFRCVETFSSRVINKVFLPSLSLSLGVSSVHAGASYSMAVSAGQLYFWGQTKSTGDATMYPKPVRDMSGWDVRSVGCS